MLRKLGLLAALLIASSTAAPAQAPFPLPLPPLPFGQGSPEERRACQDDAHKYCEREVQTGDVGRIATCMQANKMRLTSACRQVLASRGM